MSDKSLTFTFKCGCFIRCFNYDDGRLGAGLACCKDHEHAHAKAEDFYLKSDSESLIVQKRVEELEDIIRAINEENCMFTVADSKVVIDCMKQIDSLQTENTNLKQWINDVGSELPGDSKQYRNDAIDAIRSMKKQIDELKKQVEAGREAVEWIWEWFQTSRSPKLTAEQMLKKCHEARLLGKP